MDPIARIERHVGLPLPHEIRRLYELANGDQDWDPSVAFHSSGGLPMRLMSSAEVSRLYDSYGALADLRGSAGFWQGRNGTYAFAYLAGPLRGRVYFWDYDGRHMSIAYRSVPSFLEALDEAGERQTDWYQMPADYFIESDYFFHGAAACRPASPDDLASDAEALGRLRAEYAPGKARDEFEEHHYAFNLMALTPPDRTEEVAAFLDSQDMWVQERACQVLGNRKYEPAVDRLAAVARNGTANGRSAARWALQRIGSRSARQRLREVGGDR